MNFSMGPCGDSGPSLWYAWKHSIQPFAYFSWPLTQLLGPASHMCRWLSTMKYFSPLCSNIGGPLLAHRLEVEADVLGRVLGVGEHDDLVVKDDHPAVMGRHDLLEVVVPEIIPPERLSALLVVDLEFPSAVDANHRRQLGDLDVALVAHHLRDDVADLVVHERDARSIG